MKIFDFKNYKDYVRARIKTMPHGGRGEFQKLGKYLGIGSVVVSQIFKGTRDLNSEQAYQLTKYFGFNDLETDYFLALVDLEKSSHFELKKYIQKKLEFIKKQSQEIKNLIPNQSLSEEAKSIFYSDWFYSAVRLSVTVPGNNNVDAIASYLNLSKSKVQKVVHFLLSHNLLREEAGKLLPGPLRTHLEAESIYSSRYQACWRSKAIQNMDDVLEHERFFTLPMSLSKETLQIIKAKIAEFVIEVSQTLSTSQVDRLGCLNIDLFEIKK